MVFSSHIFIYYFLPAALLGYYALWGAPQRWRNFWLIITGYIFYGWAEPRFTLLMFCTTFIGVGRAAFHAADVCHNVYRLARQPRHRA